MMAGAAYVFFLIRPSRFYTSGSSEAEPSMVSPIRGETPSSQSTTWFGTAMLEISISRK